ncbi:MAG TPA: multicopper oxidase domain-containing protein [Gemmatimonadaceae bacterium]|nr:multicopper oxidase domain-containing protein [Gemmatimonadaceae bacterium]
MGRAIRGPQDEVVLATRFGNVRSEAGERLGIRGDPACVRQACDASLGDGRPGSGAPHQRRRAMADVAGALHSSTTMVSMPPFSIRCAVFALTLAAASAGAQERPCDEPRATLGPSRDLYCIALVPSPGLESLRGSVELAHIPGPFTIAVTRDGRLRHRPVFHLGELPPPATLGEYSTYVAWAVSPEMHQVVRLGAVRPGRTELREFELEKFLILVTAERTPDVAEPGGRIVLRAQSPSTRLQPPDFLEFAIGNMVRRDSAAGAAPPRPAGGDAHAGHAPGAAGGTQGAPSAPDAWPQHPMHPAVQMLPAEMALVPDAAPFLPSVADSARVPLARPRQLVRLAAGDTLRLEAGLVRRNWKGRPYLTYAFNGQQAGPLIWVAQGAEIVVDFRNALDQPTTVHWHGIRLDNRFDGVPDLTQAPVAPGGRFTYHLRFPDAGIYWYHPHVREDVQQDLGLYGNLMVRSPRADHYGPAHREEVLLLDDVLVGEGGLVPWGGDAATHALMGRFGNLFLVNGEPGWTATARRGEVVRFFLTNVSNTRTLNLSFGRGARIKVVGGDVGNYEREEWVESVVIAPAERYVVHVRFDEPGPTALVNRVRGLDHVFGRFFQEEDTLGVVRVLPERASPDLAAAFGALRADTAAAAEIGRTSEWLRRAVDRELVLTLRTRDLPFITRTLMELDSIYFAPVEWSGTMPHMNWASTSRQVTWTVRDPRTGKENMQIDDWRFRVGDVVKLRLSNQRASFHAMQHPIHLHGQRFLVLSVNGVPQENRAWKDTVLLPVGSTIDLLVEMSNPGRWMLHCHIAEHLSADMMMEFQVLTP